jgi:hypothetical protein
MSGKTITSVVETGVQIITTGESSGSTSNGKGQLETVAQEQSGEGEGRG